MAMQVDMTYRCEEAARDRSNRIPQVRFRDRAAEMQAKRQELKHLRLQQEEYDRVFPEEALERHDRAEANQGQNFDKDWPWEMDSPKKVSRFSFASSGSSTDCSSRSRSPSSHVQEMEDAFSREVDAHNLCKRDVAELESMSTAMEAQLDAAVREASEASEAAARSERKLRQDHKDAEEAQHTEYVQTFAQMSAERARAQKEFDAKIYKMNEQLHSERVAHQQEVQEVIGKAETARKVFEDSHKRKLEAVEHSNKRLKQQLEKVSTCSGFVSGFMGFGQQ